MYIYIYDVYVILVHMYMCINTHWQFDVVWSFVQKRLACHIIKKKIVITFVLIHQNQPSYTTHKPKSNKSVTCFWNSLIRFRFLKNIIVRNILVPTYEAKWDYRTLLLYFVILFFCMKNGCLCIKDWLIARFLLLITNQDFADKSMR